MTRQESPTGVGLAFGQDSATGGAWRVTVEPSLGAEEAGLWFQGSAEPKSGFLATLRGNPGVGGFALKSADGTVLWQDRFAPWRCYEAYVVEGIIESARVRAQLFEWDGKTLVSQSPWVEVPGDSTVRPGALGLYTRDAIARFWGWRRDETPLSPVVEDAPNKRRLIQDESSPWLVVGPGNWMWTTSKRERLRQCAVIERSSALSKEPHAPEGTWECRVKVDPGAGGAGMLFLTNPALDQGFIAWLGGVHGAGSLMVYRMPLDALWSGAQDNWHYDTEYVIRAETLDGKVRAALLQADGVTLIQQSPWLPMTEEEKAREGLVGFMTWLGMAEFWGFSEGTAGQTGLSGPQEAGLREAGRQGITLKPEVFGIFGRWRCRVKVADAGATTGLVFQASKDLKEGFAALLTPQGFALQTLAGQTKWEDTKVKWQPGVEYLVEGEVMTDRVAVRLFAADGTTLLSECPAVYVSDTNNRREGVLGLLMRGGKAEFSGWEVR